MLVLMDCQVKRDCPFLEEFFEDGWPAEAMLRHWLVESKSRRRARDKKTKKGGDRKIHVPGHTMEEMVVKVHSHLSVDWV